MTSSTPQDLALDPAYTFSVASDLTEEQAFQKLQQECKKAGATFKKVKLLTQKNQPRGIYADETIKKNEVVMKIPLKCAYDVESNIQKFDLDKKLNRNTTTLLESLIHGEHPHQDLQLYMHLLPNNFKDTLFFFNSIFLQKSYFGILVSLNLKWFKKTYSQHSQLAQDNTSFNEFFWTSMVFNSRQITCEGKEYLAPVADLMNHCEIRYNSRFYYNPQEQALCWVAVEKIKKGTEVIWLYKENMDTATSLLGYSIFPNKRLQSKRPLVHYFYQASLYRFSQHLGRDLCYLIIDQYAKQKTNNAPSDLIDLELLHDIYAAVGHDLQVHANARNNDKHQSLELATSEWEARVIEFIFDQERDTYLFLAKILQHLSESQYNKSLKTTSTALKTALQDYYQTLKQYFPNI